MSCMLKKCKQTYDKMKKNLSKEMGMHTIKLNVGDGIYAHLMFLLKNLKTNELEIIEDEEKELAKKKENIDFSRFQIDAFKDIKDPLAWQKEIRSEWDR